MKKLYFLVLFIITFNFTVAQDILILGGKDHDIFLGCLNCNRNNDSSIWNMYGNNGSKYNSNSIWNKYGDYGGKYSNYSPFNKYASNPPILIDREGNFYGYFSADKYFSKRTENELALFIIEDWEAISENVREAYDKIFK